MTALAIDLGGTKLSLAVFSEKGEIQTKEWIPLQHRSGPEVGQLISTAIQKLSSQDKRITSIGLAVPGIYHKSTGKVWAPNIRGWEDYPLLKELKATTPLPISIESDRACYILGERWKGAAKNCRDAIYLAVGTGIGAGIISGGRVVRGAHDIAGAIGWMALDPPFKRKYISCGCFEYFASGEGLVRTTREMLEKNKSYSGILRDPEALSAPDLFIAFDKGDLLAKKVFARCIRLWGMAVANLVSLFNPEKIIMGGGVFGPAVRFIPAIREEAVKWAQPVSMQNVYLEPSALGTDAGLFGAAWLAFRSNKETAYVP